MNIVDEYLLELQNIEEIKAAKVLRKKAEKVTRKAKKALQIAGKRSSKKKISRRDFFKQSASDIIDYGLA